MRVAPAPVTAPPERMAELRDVFERAGFDLQRIQSTLQLESELSSRPAERVVHERRLLGRSPFETLTRLFALGLAVPEPDARRAFDPIAPDRLVEMGLLEIAEGAARPLVRVVPHGDLFITCDRARDDEHAEADLVTGINAPAALLASLTVRRASRRTLDIGTGNGIQALLAARHSERVVATDVNPRALRFAEFNAALNGLDNIEFREGSLYEPVAGETFDLIVSNPPYVISPEFTYVYRDSGGAPGAICRAVLDGAAPALNEGGYAQALVSWPVTEGTPEDAVPRSWIPEGVDAWILRYRSEDPLTHAAKWNPQPDPERRARVIDSWIAYDREHHVDAVAYGAVTLRRRSAPPASVVWVTELHAGTGSAGPQVERVFRARLELDAMTDADLLSSVLRLVPEHRLDQVALLEAGGWKVTSSSLSLTAGIIFRGEIDGVLAAVLAAMDGQVSVREAVRKVVRQMSIPAGEVASTTERAAAMCRTLYGLGFLQRPGGA